MATKQNSYITAELLWAEEKLAEWKTYIDTNPIPMLKDRVEWKTTKTGGAMPMVIASIECQIKCIRDTTKEMFVLIEQINKMRQTEEIKQEARGNKGIPASMIKRPD